MSILIVCQNKDPLPWAEAIQKALPDTLVEIYPNVQSFETVAFILCWKPPEGIFRQFPNLKVIQSLGAGVDHLFTQNQDIPPGVQITRILDPQLAQDMYEFLLAACLSHLKNLPLYQQQQKARSWKQHPYKIISDSIIAVMGLGAIGGFVAKQLAAVGFQVRGWSNSSKNIPGVQSFVGQVGLPAFFKKTDILINLLPLTPQTAGILNHQTFSWMDKGAYLINVGRGTHLVEQDLLQALAVDQLSGCLLDVFEAEPLPEGHPFWDHPKISVTPHVAALTNVQTAVDQIVGNYQRMKEGAPLMNMVSQVRGY